MQFRNCFVGLRVGILLADCVTAHVIPSSNAETENAVNVVQGGHQNPAEGSAGEHQNSWIDGVWNPDSEVVTNASQYAKRARPYLPNGPTFLQFDSDFKYNAINIGFINAFELATAGLKLAQRYCPDDTSRAAETAFIPFTRYFPAGEEHRDKVIRVLQSIVFTGMGNPMMKDPQAPLQVWFGKYGGNDPEPGPELCGRSDGTLAYFHNHPDDVRRFFMVICADVFKYLPIPLRSISCASLPDKTEKSMGSLGSVVLHELTHWFLMTHFAAGIEVKDHTYGPGRCQALQEDADDELAATNADSYVWMCIEAYFLEKCGKLFKEQDDLDEAADLLGPSEGGSVGGNGGAAPPNAS